MGRNQVSILNKRLEGFVLNLNKILGEGGGPLGPSLVSCLSLLSFFIVYFLSFWLLML